MVAGLGTITPDRVVIAATVHSGAVLTDVEEISSRLVRADAEKRLNLEEYSVVRKYVLRNSRMNHDAVLTVKFNFQKGKGKWFEVVDSQGAEGMSRRVLERVIEAEVEAATPGRQENSRLTPDHYDFTLVGMESLRGRPCYVLALHPKMKSKYLLVGKAWIDAHDFAPVRVEGWSAASMSFFVGKAYIVQDFVKVGDFYMASYNQSKADSRLLGKSDLTIEYSDYEMKTIQGDRVAARGSLGTGSN
ncbi:MAG: hypothetical protein JO022_13785 [Acidobacteriaceae bacterium]|nr:hypothetical protein [Acidobacteriaceae bacterium]